MVSIKRPNGDPAEVETHVNALCAVARPERFIDTIEHHGYHVAHEKLLTDHDDLMGKKLFAGFDATLPVVVTEKDWVKLKQRTDLGIWTILVASYEVQLEPADKFREWLKEKLDGVRK